MGALEAAAAQRRSSVRWRRKPRSGVGGVSGWVARSEDRLTMPARHALGLGLELVVPAAGHPAREDFVALASLVSAAEEAGYSTVWLRGASDAGRGVDPVPVVGALVERTTSLGLGVVCGGGSGRHPAILARELTTLDGLSGGRAALHLVAPSGAQAWARLSESVQVCRLLFSDDGAVDFDGEHFSVHLAANRPTPEFAGGPLLLVGLPGRGDRAALDALLAGAHGAVVEGSVAAVAGGRAELDGATAGGRAERPSLVWRGRLPSSSTERVSLVEAVTSAGADAVIIRLGEGRAASPRDVRDAGAAILPLLTRAA